MVEALEEKGGGVVGCEQRYTYVTVFGSFRVYFCVGFIHFCLVCRIMLGFVFFIFYFVFCIFILCCVWCVVLVFCVLCSEFLFVFYILYFV